MTVTSNCSAATTVPFTIIVNDEQYSLAIGKSGQNVRLACYTTDWKIDIKRLSEALKEGIDFRYNVYLK